MVVRRSFGLLFGCFVLFIKSKGGWLRLVCTFYFCLYSRCFQLIFLPEAWLVIIFELLLNKQKNIIQKNWIIRSWTASCALNSTTADDLHLFFLYEQFVFGFDYELPIVEAKLFCHCSIICSKLMLHLIILLLDFYMVGKI